MRTRARNVRGSLLAPSGLLIHPESHQRTNACQQCACMLEVYVETFGALSKREKIDFILEQIR